MIAYRAGDVVSYRDDNGRWCREGMAKVVTVTGAGPETLILVDTYWQSGHDAHVLTDAEAETAELLFNLTDYREVRNYGEWSEYHPDDRQLVTSQHGLQKTYYVRAGAKPDLATKVENAVRASHEAEAEVTAAIQRADWRREELHRLVAQLEEAQS